MRGLLAAATARIGQLGRVFSPPSDLAIAARAFDSAYYLRIYPDVAEVGCDPLEHFMEFGWREGRDPNAAFSVAAYLEVFPEVAASGVNPFVHYLTHGRPKAAPPEPPLGFRFEVIEQLETVETRMARARGVTVEVGTAADLAAALAQSRGGLADLHVTFSHDDFSTNLGGLQLTIGREAARLAELERDHLHLHSARPWGLVRTPDEPEALGVVWNGQAVGAFTPEVLTGVLQDTARGEASGRSFAIHSLLGHEPDEVADILAAVGLKQGVFWLHDFASLCAGFHLLRNEVEDCAAPPPGSPTCGVCIHGPWRERHTQAHARLFERLSLTVAAPSQVTLDLWRASTDLPAAATVVLPHARLAPKGPARVSARPRPFRFAYAGLPVTHKGWPAFRALAARFINDPRYEFIHLGVRRDLATPFRFEAVAAGPANPTAMRDALLAVEADAVMVWPLCRETFSFVAYEAVAAGCAVVTGPDSGNVAAFVADTGHGQVLPDETALAQAFESGAILQLARAQRRPMLYDLVYSALTLDLAKTPTP